MDSLQERIETRAALLFSAAIIAASMAYLIPILLGGHSAISHTATINLDMLTPRLSAFLGCSAGVAGGILGLVQYYGTSITWLTKALVWSGFGFAVSAIVALGVSYILYRIGRYGWSSTVGW